MIKTVKIDKNGNLIRSESNEIQKKQKKTTTKNKAKSKNKKTGIT